MKWLKNIQSIAIAGVAVAGVVILAPAALNVLQGKAPLSLSGSPAPGNVVADQSNSIVCDGIATTGGHTETFRAEDMRTSAQLNTTVGTFRVYDKNNGILSTSVATAGTLTTINPGEKFSFIAGDAAASTYYTIAGNGKSSCGPASLTVAKLPLVGTVSVNSFRTNDNTLVSTTNLQAVGSGEGIPMHLDFKETTADAYWGNPTLSGEGAYLVALAYNSSALDSSKFTLEGCTSTDVPQLLSGTLSTAEVLVTNSTYSYQKAFKCPNVIGAFETQGKTLFFQAKSGVNPGADLIELNILPYDRYVNTRDASKIEVGVNKDDGSVIKTLPAYAGTKKYIYYN